MLRRIVALALAASWILAVGNHSVALDRGEQTTALTKAVSNDGLWAQPSSGSRDLLGSPLRYHQQDLVLLATASRRLLTEESRRLLRRSRPVTLRADSSGRRILHHHAPSSSDDGSAG